jgi:hypothetical protein
MLSARSFVPVLALIGVACTKQKPTTALHDPLILEVSRGGRVIAPDAGGQFPALPSKGVGIKLQAEWPGELDVSVDQVALVRRPTGQSNAAYVTQGYFVVTNIDPKPSPQMWEIAVVAPSAKHSASKWDVGIASRSATPGGPVTKPTVVHLVAPPAPYVPPTAGTRSIELYQPASGGSSVCTGITKEYETQILAEVDAAPASAKVVSVKNTSQFDIVVWHEDDTGRKSDCVPLKAYATNSDLFANGGFTDMGFFYVWRAMTTTTPPSGFPLSLPLEIKWTQ